MNRFSDLKNEAHQPSCFSRIFLISWTSVVTYWSSVICFSTLATAALLAVSIPTLSNSAEARRLGGFGMHGGFGHVGGWGRPGWGWGWGWPVAAGVGLGIAAATAPWGWGYGGSCTYWNGFAWVNACYGPDPYAWGW